MYFWHFWHLATKRYFRRIDLWSLSVNRYHEKSTNGTVLYLLIMNSMELKCFTWCSIKYTTTPIVLHVTFLSIGAFIKGVPCQLSFNMAWIVNLPIFNWDNWKIIIQKKLSLCCAKRWTVFMFQPKSLHLNIQHKLVAFHQKINRLCPQCLPIEDSTN